METQLVLEAAKAALPDGKRQAETMAVFNALANRIITLRTDPDRWSFFVDLLVAAEAEDLILLPSQDGDGWNREVFPARPKWVRLPSSKEPKEKFDHRGFPWNPALCFLASERGLPKGIREAALAIQRFFVSGGSARPPVPVKERSFDIFGEEKRLDGLRHSEILFGPGKISLEFLRCYVVEPTPVAERFDQGDGIIILENEATFDSFCRLCRQKPTYRLVIYGRGHEIQKCTAYLRREVDRYGAQQITYFGDVDRRGFEIPQQLALNAKLGAKIVPLLPGYEFLLRETPTTKDQIPGPCSWLPESLAARAASVVSAGRAIPQEAFGWDELAAMHNLNPFLT
jgi:hypothetical protein